MNELGRRATIRLKDLARCGMNMTVNYRQFALEVLNRTKYHSDEEEIQKLEQQMQLISEHGMDDLNQVLLSNARGSSRKVLDFIAEHNFAADLIRFDPESTLLYEPSCYSSRPTDFVRCHASSLGFMQMKRLNESESDNRRKKMLDRLVTNFQSIPVGKFIVLNLSEDFKEVEVQPLTNFIASSVQSAVDRETLYYPTEEDPIATFSFYPPNRLQLKHLTLAAASDSEFVDITGVAETQVKASLEKAAGAFEWDNSHQRINLIVMEAENYEDIDISQAVFGTEIYVIQGSTVQPGRDADGFFHDPSYCNRLCGVIALRRVDGGLITSYRKTLFINERFLPMVDQVRQMVDIEEVITTNDWP